MSNRSLYITVNNNNYAHTLSLDEDQLYFLPAVIEAILPVLHTAGWPQLRMRVDSDENIQLYAEFPKAEPVDVTPVEVYEAEDAFETLDDYWDVAVDAVAAEDARANPVWKIGDRVRYIGHDTDWRGNSLTGKLATVIKVGSESTLRILIAFDDKSVWCHEGNIDDDATNRWFVDDTELTAA